MFLDILFLLNKTNYKFMTFLEFLNKQSNKVNESKVEAILDGEIDDMIKEYLINVRE